MSAKAIIVFCAQALFVQSALSQCTSRAAIAAAPGIDAPAWAEPAFAAPYGLAAPGFAAPYGLAGSAFGGSALAAPCGYASPAMDFTPTSGGALPVSSASARAPVGLAVESENVYEGILAAVGELPFVGTVAVEGVLPTAGAGAVNHACGNGRNAMISEGAAFSPAYGAAAITPAGAISPYGAAAGLAGYGAATGLAAAELAAPGFGYRAGLAGRGCGCGI